MYPNLRKAKVEFVRDYSEMNRARLSGPASFLGRMKEFWGYFKDSFPEGEELWRRIRTARTAEARLTMRLLATVEEQLAEPTALYKGQWGDTERKLYRALDIAEREGGELHRRWQHCLANVLVRQMEEEREAMEDGRRKMEYGSGDGDQNTTTN